MKESKVPGVEGRNILEYGKYISGNKHVDIIVINMALEGFKMGEKDKE